MSRPLTLVASPLHLLALVAFFLPFYSVSCQGRPLAESSGYEAATEGFRVDERVERGLGGGGAEPDAQRRRGSASWLLLFPALAAAAAACAAIAAWRPGPGAARARLASAALGLGGVIVLVAHYVHLRGDLRRALEGTREGAEGTGAELGREVASAMLQGVTLDLRAGWWIALLAALAGSAVAAAAQVLPPAPPPPPGGWDTASRGAGGTP